MVQELLISSLAGQVGVEDPAILVTRRLGQRFLVLLDHLLTQAPEGVVVLDFHRVEIMDASFLDEVFGTLAAHRTEHVPPNRCLLLYKLTETNRENLMLTLQSRPPREPGLRNCVLPVLTTDRRVELVGKMEGHVRETIDLLQAHRQLTARQLAELLDLDIHAASTRFKVLFDLGLATRDEGSEVNGKQFVYVWPF